jgi:hypothetical protein
MIRLISALAVLIVFGASVASAGQLTLSMRDGRVTLVAREVPLRQILAEWARVGRTQIVNADKVTGPSVTLTLTDVPEASALETLLRGVSGYMIARRVTDDPGASQFDRILIMPTSLPAPSFAAAAPSAPPPMLPTAMPPAEDPAADDLQEEGDAAAQQQMGAPGAPIGSVAPGYPPAGVPMRPPETTFDYANPQQMMQQRAVQQQNAQPPTTFPGTAPPPATFPSNVPPATFPSNVPPAAVPNNEPAAVPVPGAQTSPRPTILPTPQSPNAPRNPYGIPSNVPPGSVVAPPQEPDRSKYANPIPSPPPPPPDN